MRVTHNFVNQTKIQIMIDFLFDFHILLDVQCTTFVFAFLLRTNDVKSTKIKHTYNQLQHFGLFDKFLRHSYFKLETKTFGHGSRI